MPSTRIPNHLRWVWTGPRFPLFARLSVESARLACPGVPLTIHAFGPRPDGAEHFEALRAMPGVTIDEVDLPTIFGGLDAPAEDYLALLDRIPATAWSARSNLVRYGILHHLGGVYVDFDTLFLRGMDDLLHHEAFIGAEGVWKVDEHRVEGQLAPWMIPPTITYVAAWLLRRGVAAVGGYDVPGTLGERLDASWSVPNLNNAVIGSEPGGIFLRRVLAAALQSRPDVRYHLGPTLVSRVWRREPFHVHVCPPAWFYMEPPSYSFRFFLSRPWPMPKEAVLMHYVSSNHGALLAGLDEATIRARRDRAPFYARAAEVLDAR